MHTRHILLGLALLVASFGFTVPALANTTPLSFDPSYSTGPFIFYCQPYAASFVEGEHYPPTDGPC
ncbi:MAG: hypothetical protein G01um101456_583, partial [Parcubacteria group bacterium Gr01-1014_56]